MNSPRKRDIIDDIESLKGKVVKEVHMHWVISLGILSVTVEFTDGSFLQVEPTKYGQQKLDALGVMVGDQKE